MERALIQKNNTKITCYDQTISCQPVIPKNILEKIKRKEIGCNIYVTNLDKETTYEDFHKYFRQFGEFFSSKLPNKDGKSLGYGYVNFKNNQDAEKCIQLSNEGNMRFGEKTIKVEKFKA